MKEYKSLTELIPEMEPDEIFYKRIFLEYPELIWTRHIQWKK